MGLTRRLTERTANPFAGSTVDRAAGVIRNVLVCGSDSANGRRYPWGSGLKGSIGLYEGRPVNCDHGSHGAVATVDRRLGWLASPHAGEDGRPRADLHVLKSHPMADRVFEAAERNPAVFGLSHVALCKTRREGGTEVVESIESVESVDLVADPATTKGLFESKGGRAMALSVRRLCEWLVKHERTTAKQVTPLKRLAEMDGMDAAPVAGMDDLPAADADPDDAVMAAFKAAIGAVVDQAMSGSMDPKEALNKIKTLLKSHGELNSDGTPDTDDDPETGAAEESKRRKNLPDAWDVLAECRTAGYDPTPSQLKALSRMSDAAERKEFVAECKDAMRPTGERPTSGGRHQFAEHRDEKVAAKKVAESKGNGGTGGDTAADLPWLT